MATTAAIRRLGGESAAAVWTKGIKRRLFSFYYHGFSGGQFEKDEKTGLSTAIADSVSFGWELFLDSGAFTAFTQNKVMDVKEYASYICKHQAIWSTCSSLDAIGSGEVDSDKQLGFARQSYAYFAELRNRGAKVQPVYHVREPRVVLEKYIDLGYDYIFIGGMVPETTQWLMQRLDYLWTNVLTLPDGSPKIKVHGFGLTDQLLMFRYPWYSVDSSSWLMTGIFGACMFRTGKKGKPLQKVVFSEESPEARKDKGWHYHRRSRADRDLVDSWIEPFGITAEQLSQHYSFRDVVNASVFQDLEDLGTERFVNKQPTLLI